MKSWKTFEVKALQKKKIEKLKNKLKVITRKKERGSGKNEKKELKHVSSIILNKFKEKFGCAKKRKERKRLILRE